MREGGESKTEVILDGFSVLIIRLKRASEKLMQDMELIMTALEKLRME